MSKVYEDIERAREERRLRREQREAAEKAARDSIALANSLQSPADSIGTAVKDSVSLTAAADSLAAKTAVDSTAIKSAADTVAAKPLTEKELKSLKRSAAKKRRNVFARSVKPRRNANGPVLTVLMQQRPHKRLRLSLKKSERRSWRPF